MMYSVVIPVFNEEANIQPLYQSLKSVMEKIGDYEIIFVDDGSTDSTFSQIKGLHSHDKKIKCLRFRKNFGQTPALRAGFDFAHGDYIITIDGDLQNDPSDIPILIEKIQEGYDVVSGWRFPRHDSFSKRIFSKFSNWLARRLTGVMLHDFGCTLKAYKKEVIQDIELYGEMHRYIPAIIAWKGFSVTELQVHHHPRRCGKTKYGATRLMKGFFDLVNFKFWSNFSTNPLHFFGGVGLLSFFSGFFMALYLAIMKFFFSEKLSNRPLLLLALLLMILGVQLTMFGFLAEMMTRNYFASSQNNHFEIKEIVE